MRSMPNSHLVPAQNTRRGVVLLGDANNMRHPLTGGGMTVAFWDVVHLRDALRGADLDDADDLRRRVKSVHWKRKEISATVNILANALYALFAAGSDPYAKVLQDGCVGYFKLGGICVSTPIGLLSGMLANPLALIVHFFAVAIYGMLLLFVRRPVYELPLTVVRAVGAIITACAISLLRNTLMADKKEKLAALAAAARAKTEAAETKGSKAGSSSRQSTAKPAQSTSAKHINRREEEYARRLAKETRGKNLDEYDKEDGFLVDSDEEEEDADDDDEEEEEDDSDDGRKKRKKSGSGSSTKKDKKRDKGKAKKKSRKDDDDSDASGGSGSGDDDDKDSGDELDTSVIISSRGRSTRGRKIDFTQFGMDRPEDDE
ncbi:Squalene epoxidase [Entophlyctis luteolus]|nr:Squalene epoxidase [Entophlyctis luteolus]